MPSDRFEKNSISWQLQQFKQSVGEGIEQFLANLRFNPPPSGDSPKTPNWDLGWLLYWRYFLLTVVLLLALAWLVWWLWPIAKEVIDRWRQRQGPEVAGPYQSARSASLLAQDARDYGTRGNYREACRALYLAMLQQLNDRKILQNQPSRTDGEYTRLVEPLKTAQAHQRILEIHEQITFRPGPVDAATFKACETAYNTIDQAAENPPSTKK
jgi:hypothetical protein